MVGSNSVQGLAKSTMRVAKNSIKGYSDVQTKVREATSNDPWGPSGTQMSEIAQLTYNQNDFVEIMEMLDKRLNDKGKNWRHVFKSLTLLDYILNSGSENVVMYFRENMYIVKTLKEFQYIDENGKDQGANVRQKAKDITNLLLDEKRMRESRNQRGAMNDKMAGRDRSNSAVGRNDRHGDGPRRPASVPAGGRGGDRDLEAAIAASEASAREEAARMRNNNQGDKEMEEAMRLSREEEEERKRRLAQNSGQGLFDEQRSNNLIDMDTPFQQPMQTGFQSFNPYAQQQLQQQEEWARQQQMMELQRQADEQAAYQNMLQQQAYAQQQQQAQEEYMRQQAYQQQMYLQQQHTQQQQMQPLVPQPTAYGSNNPFAAFSPTPAAASPPPLPTTSSFTGFSQSAPPATATPPPAASPVRQRPPRDDGKHADLAKMLAGGREDGLDTFGNIGAMRVPVGQQFATRTGMAAQPTGSRPNPFTQQQQQQQQPQQQQQQQQQSGQNALFDF